MRRDLILGMLIAVFVGGALTGAGCMAAGFSAAHRTAFPPVYRYNPQTGIVQKIEDHPPKEPVEFLHDASDEEIAVRKQPYLKRVMDAIRGK